jgi:hypothetical protein
MAFAVETKVPVAQTQGEIKALVSKAGARSFASMEEPSRAMIAFELGGRRIRFTLPLPDEKAPRRDQVMRTRWRALLLVIKAKLESVESKIETFDEAFLAHIQMPSGRTVMEEIHEPLAIAYKGGNVPLLPNPKS